MKPLLQDSAAMATKCSSNVTMVTDYTVHMRSNRGHRHAYANHRKSAVELLEASKGEYVKSTKVLNHKQKLKHPENLSVGNREVPLCLSPSEDIVNSTSETFPDNSGHHKVPSSEQRAHSKSPPTHHIENHKSSSGNHSTSPPTIKKRSSSVTHSADRNNSVPSAAVTPTSSPVLSSVSSSSQTISSSSVRKSSVISAVSSAAESSTSFISSPSAAKKLSTTSSAGSSLSVTSSHSNTRNDDHVIFQKPLTPPSSSTVRPVVPPKPTSKPSVAPKVGPKPVIHKPDKPVPPPRPARKSTTPKSSESLDDSTDISDRAMSSTEKKSSVNSSSPLTNTPDQKRFSSVSASACETSSKDIDGKGVSVRESRYSLSSQSDVFLKPLSANNLSTSVGVLVERKRSPIPKPRIDKQLNEVELPPRRPLHRSQSDLSNCRHSRTSSDFSDLSSRLSRTSTEVERFFNEMGIDHSVLEPMRRLSQTKHKDHLDSVSSLDSLDGRSLSSRLSNDLDRLPMESEQDLSERDPGTTSVVERNARIIKWLCNVKKARNVQTRHVNRKS